MYAWRVGVSCLAFDRCADVLGRCVVGQFTSRHLTMVLLSNYSIKEETLVMLVRKVPNLQGISWCVEKGEGVSFVVICTGVM